MSSSIPLPSYPAGSHNWLKRMYAAKPVPESPEPKDLRIAIIGAGVGGLATAVALKTAGFPVTVYEHAAALSEIGAGIQVPPNSTRLLHSWGLEEKLRKKAVKPHGIVWRRWANGAEVGHTRLNPQLSQAFGAPYYVIHRAHLHEVLHERAVELDVPIKLNSGAMKYNVDEPSFVLRDGTTISTDLIVAADGIHSHARQTLKGEKDTAPISSGFAAYRATVPVDKMQRNPKTAWIAESGDLNLWVGDQTHAMTYTIAGGRLFNMVLTRADDGTHDENDASAMANMKAAYAGWDSSLTTLLDMVDSTRKWPIAQIKIPETWSSGGAKLVLLGDAAHAMLPNMALGAAMAVEDAAALAEILKVYPHKDTLRTAIDVYENIRIPRTKAIQESSVLHGYTIHYADGPLQEARDAAMRPQVDNEYYIESPDQWSDPMTQRFCYQYDVRDGVHKALHKRGAC